MTTPNATPFSSQPLNRGAGIAFALNAEGKAPEWVQLLPRGPKVQGRDGRAWTLDANKVAAATQLPFALDYEHAQDLKAINGEMAPASGWVEELDIRDGETWARVDWTPNAAAVISAREYRFLSPAFAYSREDGAITRLVGGGLVNRPNFSMTALNREEPSMLKAICAALALAETATETDIVTAIGRLKEATALNAETLARYVPRADYDLALNRATIAEGKLAEDSKARHAEKVALAIDGAIKAGKVAPASRDYHVAVCSTAEGLAAFEKFVAGAASAFGAVDLTKSDPNPGAGKTALNAEQLVIARGLGIPEDKFAEHLAKAAAKAAA
jgi:phage I-like protein